MRQKQSLPSSGAGNHCLPLTLAVSRVAQWEYAVTQHTQVCPGYVPRLCTALSKAALTRNVCTFTFSSVDAGLDVHQVGLI